MRKVLERIKREPVMVTALVVAVANLAGVEIAPGTHEVITTVVVFVVGLVLRHFVTPAAD